MTGAAGGGTGPHLGDGAGPVGPWAPAKRRWYDRVHKVLGKVGGGVRGGVENCRGVGVWQFRCP